MKVSTAEFETSAPSLEACPAPEYPELAFVGRSNVGKSSLINLLSGRRGQLAKVSGAPGKTRLINFFLINNAWRLVDLPGYGYARVSKKERRIFQDFVSDYLVNRENLLGVFVLVDSRLPPQPIDLDFVHWLAECSVPFAVIFTKSDKLSKAALRKNKDVFLESLRERVEGDPDHFVSSAKSGAGRSDILTYIGENLSELG